MIRKLKAVKRNLGVQKSKGVVLSWVAEGLSKRRRKGKTCPFSLFPPRFRAESFPFKNQRKASYTGEAKEVEG
jgi:hypothetical protein